MPVQKRRLLPAGVPGSIQTRMLRLYCETTIATWCLTFWRCLLSICCVWKASAAKWENASALSVSVLSVCGWQRKAEKHRGVPGRRAAVVFVFILSGFLFCLCLRCVYFFFFLLTFDVAWLVVGGHSLRHLEPANGRSVIQLGSLSSRVMPPWRGWHALLEHMLPGWSDDARNT